MSNSKMQDWRIFHGNGTQETGIETKLENIKTPPWRQFGNQPNEQDQERWESLQKLAEKQERNQLRGKNFRIAQNQDDIINAVNAAIYLRRPLLVTGKPGAGKTSLAYAIAYELKLGPVLSWPITTRSTLQEGLYSYDALARLQDSQTKEQKDIGEYIKLGPLGTAFLPSKLPRVLLIDEVDKSDINLPNDLLNILEEGEFEIPELVRRSQNAEDIFTVRTQDQDISAKIKAGRVGCAAFPIIVMTSNGERDFPPAFNRRCVRVIMPDPDSNTLQTIVDTHFEQEKQLLQKSQAEIGELIKEFLKSDTQSKDRATDQLLNVVYLLTREVSISDDDKQKIKELLFKKLNDN
ncbi:MAG: MoxR family ATPase [Sphaerospermopsis sp.]|nr:MoxR family ATPase [Sphaerospermopsis sp.]